MTKIKNLWMEYKVFIFGLAGAILLTLQQFSSETQVDGKVVGIALGMAAISYVAKNWRGQSASIIGIIGNFGYAFETVLNTGHFTWAQLIIQLTLVFGFAFMPDPKSRGYEQTATIKNAKIEGEVIQPASLTNSEIKEEARKQSA